MTVVIEEVGEQPKAAGQQQQPRQQQPLGLYIATPAYGCQVTVPYLASVLSLQGECMKRGVRCMVDLVGNESLISRGRCIMTARFLKSDATHLMWIDADIAFSAGSILDRLLPFALEHPDDVVTGVYAKKAFNFDRLRAGKGSPGEPTHSVGLDYNINVSADSEVLPNGYAKVHDSATGFMLIPRQVILDMNEKYKTELGCVNDIPGSVQDIPEYVALFDTAIDPESRRYLSEDYAFVRLLQRMGRSVYVDLASPLAHYGTYGYHGDIRSRFKLVYQKP